MNGAADGPGRGSGLSRRTLLGAAAIAAPLGLGLAACGSASSGASAEATASTGTAAKGGSMRIARPPASSAESLDPASSLSAYEYLGALYNRLVKQAEDGSVLPDLATSWESSADSTTWTFALRKGVTFHNGKAFTSADAAYTLAHILDPKIESPQAAVLSPFLSASGISTPDAGTLVVKLSSPNAEFPSLLMNYNCYVIPDGSAKTIGSTGIGTGPFKLKSFVPAGQGTVLANKNHFGGAPILDSIVFTAIADIQARVNALLAGQVDLIAQTNIDYATSKTVTASSIATTATVKNAEWYVMPMLTKASPFTDVNVREAFKIAYQPTDLLDLALHGRGTVANNNPVPPSDANYLDYKVAPDPDKAKSLLKTAGLSATQQLYTSSYDAVLTPLALAYQSSVKNAGLNISIQTASADSYFTDVWMQKPFCVSYWYTGRPVDQLLNQIFRAGSSYNETTWSDAQFGSVLDAARKESDAAKRKQHYQDAQKILVDRSGSIVPFFADRTTGLSKKVVNYKEYGFEFDYLHIGFAA
ncbi:ABC transporter substrate-binding protein [Actinospica sp.]|uniref:ABC transporter substrate-binding protein n=1 Tax=Actinospica sp. TaxID=1872142 RepID=UPI002BB8A12D|nr:ABC transporter substrate-binding protein [Actinospica sp.]HWG22487.1 ABC transporter substrate-binding protein [Actinospica sp.]